MQLAFRRSYLPVRDREPGLERGRWRDRDRGWGRWCHWSPTVGALSSREVESLTFTREEEKLARDVYGALSAKDPLFSNIGKSEQTHMDAIATLLTRYGLPDPVGTNGPGKSNATLQARLYDALVAEGARSNLSALAVGVEIEELDIFDIELAKKDVTHADVLATYDTLTRGSRNHSFRSFYGKLVAAGGLHPEAPRRRVVQGHRRFGHGARALTDLQESHRAGGSIWFLSPAFVCGTRRSTTARRSRRPIGRTRGPLTVSK